MLRNFRQVFKGNQTPMAVVMMVVLARHGGLPGAQPRQSRRPGQRGGAGLRPGHHEAGPGPADAALIRSAGQQANLEALGPIIQSQALARLVQGKLVEELAERHGVVVTDGEIKAALEARLRQIPRSWTRTASCGPPPRSTRSCGRHGMSLKEMRERHRRRPGWPRSWWHQAAAQVPVDAAWLDVENRVRNEKISLRGGHPGPRPSRGAGPRRRPSWRPSCRLRRALPDRPPAGAGLRGR